MEQEPAKSGAEGEPRQHDGRASLPGLAGILPGTGEAEDAYPLLETVIASMTEALVVVDADGRLVLHNPASLALHGYEERQEAPDTEEVTTVWEVADLAHNPLPLEKWPLARALQGERFTEHVVRVRRTDTGKKFVGAYSGTPILDERGNLRYALITIRDVTRRREAEEKLAAQGQAFTTLANSIPQLAWMTDETGWVTWYNRRWYEYTGTTPEEVEGWGWQKVHHPDHVGRVVNHIQEAFARGEPWEDTFPLRGKDGKYRWFLSRALPIQDEEGRIVRWFGTNTDITERLQLERALRQREGQLRRLNLKLEERIEKRSAALARSGEAILEARNRFYTLFHSSPIPTVLTALDTGLILDVNAAYLNFFELERAEVVGHPAGELADERGATPEGQERLRRLVREQGRAANVELRAEKGSGDTYTLLVSVETATLDGQPVAVASLLDVTERKRAEERVRRLAAEPSLAEERERRRIAQILHDDLQQMLVALQIQVQMAASGDLDDTRAALSQAGRFLDEIIETTRNLSVELSSPSLESERLQDSFAWIRAFVAEHYGLNVHLDVVEEATIPDPDIRAVVVRLVRELLFNVVKHADVKEAWLSAKIQAGALLIRVQDEGQGFDPSLRAQQREGTGHGLRRMGERVRLFGGAFHLESAPGAGTRVTIALPQP